MPDLAALRQHRSHNLMKLPLRIIVGMWLSCVLVLSVVLSHYGIVFEPIFDITCIFSTCFGGWLAGFWLWQRREAASLPEPDATLQPWNHYLPNTCLDEAQLAVAIHDLGHRCLYVNTCMVDLLGYESSQLRRVKFMDIFHPDVRDLTLQSWLQLEQGQCAYVNFETRLLKANGSVIDAQILAHSLRNIDGAIDTIVSFTLDISDRRSMERQARAQQDVMMAVMQHATEGLLLLDGLGRIILANPAASSLFSQETSLQGQSWQDVFQAETLDEVLVLAETPPRRPHTIKLKHRGLDTLLEMNLSRLEIPSSPCCWVMVLRDISATKSAEMQLRTARDKAEMALRSQADFFAMISHEIRTPMNGVIGTAQLLAQTPLQGEQRSYVHTLVNSGQQLLELINDILDMSRLDAGKLELEYLDFDLQKLLEEALDLHQSRVAAKPVQLSVHWAPGTLFHVKGDIQRLRQILMNLVGNAIKFTQQGSIHLDVAARQQGSKQVKLSITVEDTGIGIPEEHIQRLFVKFSQADASTSRRFGGTGLGLAICKALVSLMEGDIWVRSVEGQGTVFGFYVMLELSTQPITPLLMPLLGTGRMWLVDELAGHREQVRLLFSSPWRVTEMRHLSSGYAEQEDTQPDLILLDDSPSNRQQWAALWPMPPRPACLLLTTTWSPGLESELLDLGLQGYLIKPLRAEQMQAALQWLQEG
ncbi:MAG: PAS domain S-box protein, partial [Pseudomonadales bacterium]|nr:PAS domain S-box protein [Pseudomonadales bacterium]